MKKLISIVIPIFNEAENIPLLYERLMRVLHKLISTYDYELIMIDDGSKDTSWQLLSALAQKDPCVYARKFSRNFGHQIALTAGYDAAHGDCIISMDADLQDPPELILD